MNLWLAIERQFYWDDNKKSFFSRKSRTSIRPILIPFTERKESCIERDKTVTVAVSAVITLYIQLITFHNNGLKFQNLAKSGSNHLS